MNSDPDRPESPTYDEKGSSKDECTCPNDIAGPHYMSTCTLQSLERLRELCWIPPDIMAESMMPGPTEFPEDHRPGYFCVYEIYFKGCSQGRENGPKDLAGKERERTFKLNQLGELDKMDELASSARGVRSSGYQRMVTIGQRVDKAERLRSERTSKGLTITITTKTSPQTLYEVVGRKGGAARRVSRKSERILRASTKLMRMLPPDPTTDRQTDRIGQTDRQTDRIGQTDHQTDWLGQTDRWTDRSDLTRRQIRGAVAGGSIVEIRWKLQESSTIQLMDWIDSSIMGSMDRAYVWRTDGPMSQELDSATVNQGKRTIPNLYRRDLDQWGWLDEWLSNDRDWSINTRLVKNRCTNGIRGSAGKRHERASMVAGRRDVRDGTLQVGIRACLILGWISAREKVMIHPNPAVRSPFQAASVLQVMNRGSDRFCISVSPIGRIGGFVSWARNHSFAWLIAWERTSIGWKCLSLKILLLRAVHIDQNTHGESDPSPKPIGGRQVSNLDVSNPALKYEIRFRFKEDVHGKDSQTLLAKSQVKKRWVTYSSSASQWIHFALSKMV
ncbi:hypothetical protein ISN44_As07g012030 [Arabidopsis suecica]|uniref:Uncharacterized protein n=1 Tax=Arabidopsis suecica TaxID=45249 RepID=A0A8T2BTB7_ARASU|nr:hypothetical protein ISN44_As07g012030 [Arabidopsis suecica]